jgi:transaldolase
MSKRWRAARAKSSMPPTTDAQPNRIGQLRRTGVSIWLDSLSRDMLDDGSFERFERELAITGATSNPTIFAKAICGSGHYDSQLTALLERGVTDPRELFLELALEDVRRAAELLLPVYEQTAGDDGYVSFECTPDVAYTTAATIAQARTLWRRLDAPNVMIKVPATEPGIAAIEELTAAGVNVNVTLLFDPDRYGDVIEAYLRGLECRFHSGQSISQIQSVASFFVSRVDVKADALLPLDSPLRGRIGTENARHAYALYREAFRGNRWRRLETQGASPQRPLWASTAAKDPAYSDVMYLEQLPVLDTVLTVPEQTLRAFADHGVPGRGFRTAYDIDASTAVDLRVIARALEREGVQAFQASYVQLLECIEKRLRGLEADAGRAPVAIEASR